ncbi:MAG: redoxin domain-containing protein, partial [Pseudohongiellaceae bacterium]
MKTTRLFGLLLIGLLLSPVINAADRVGDFSLLDQDGYFHQMSWYDDHAAIALLVQANGSAAAEQAAPAFAALQARYDEQGIQFFMINPLGTQSREAVKAELERLGVSMPVLMDDSQLISESLGVEQTGEVLVFDPKSFTVEFRGPVGDELEQALTAKVAGGSIMTARVPMQGEAVTYAVKTAHAQSTPSYESDIAPIIADNCAKCHREGGIAPFALNSHAMVQGWSPMIREVVMTKRMPPGQIDPTVGHFINDMVLDSADQQKLLHWIAAGSPRDGQADPLAQLTWPESKWAFGEPDYVIKLPPQSVPATGVLDYRQIVVPIETDK